MSKKDEALKLALEHAKRDERHMNNAETRYWCRMYRDIAEKAIEALAEQPAHTITKEKLQQIVASYVDSPMLVEELWHSLKPAQQQGAVGSLSVRYYLGCKSMTNTDFDYYGDLPEGDYELYTSPTNVPTARASKPWVSLTDEEILACDPQEECWGLFDAARSIEAKLKEKNNG